MLTLTIAKQISLASAGAILLSLGLSEAVKAIQIDFEDVAVPVGTEVTRTSDVISGNFLFDWVTDHGHLSNAGTLATNPWNTDNGSTYLVTDDFDGDNLLTMSRLDAGTFSLNSIDFAEWLGIDGVPGSNDDFAARNVTVTGNLLGGGTVVKTVVMDLLNDGAGPNNDFQTEFFDGSWANLTSVTFDGQGGFNSYFAIDNLTVNEDSPSVPEPASTLGLLAFGIFGAGSMFKGKQKRNA